MLMIMNAYEVNKRDAMYHWGCHKNEETKEQPQQENKSMVDAKELNQRGR